MVPALLGWLAVGLLVGFVVSKLVNLRGDDPKLGILAAIIGSFIGAVIYRIASGVETRAWNSWSVLMAAIGAGVCVTVWHLVRSRTISHERHHVRQSH